MTSIRSIDLNADLGEHDGEGAAADAAMLDVVSSASIACGAHAGSREVMTLTVEAAIQRGVAIGAHPSYPDREGFGRRELNLPLGDVLSSLRDQVEELAECCAATGAALLYIKPHGALYNRAARERHFAAALAECVQEMDADLWMLALAGSALEQECRAIGLQVSREAFIDRAYMRDGSLVPRDRAGAVLDDAEAAASRALEMARENSVLSIEGMPLTIMADSLCVHGDSRKALEIVMAARTRLEEAGFLIAPFSR